MARKFSALSADERASKRAEFITGNSDTLADFCRKNDILYESYARQCFAKEQWIEQRTLHIQQTADKCIAINAEKRIQTATERQNATLDLCQQIREKAIKLLVKTDSGIALNALASACYRLNEVESAILNYKGGTNDSQKEALEELARLIDEGTKR